MALHSTEVALTVPMMTSWLLTLKLDRSDVEANCTIGDDDWRVGKLAIDCNEVGTSVGDNVGN